MEDYGTLPPDVVLSGIPERWRGRVEVVLTEPTSMEGMPFVRALWEAFGFLDPIVGLEHVAGLKIIIGTSPFLMQQRGVFSMGYVLDPSPVCAYHGRFVFMDLVRMATTAKEDAWSAIVLEELVHVVMHITDENKVKGVVAILHPRVTVRDGKYTLRAQ